MQEPLPATGPYMFETYDPKEGLVLVRNPHFRECSPVAQPDGYPDRIVWRFGIEGGKAVDQVTEGDVDWVWSELGLSDLAPIMRQTPELVHSYTQTVTWYMSLGTTRPPFDDVRVRRALNFAVDRSRVVELFGGSEQARPTCQVLPQSIPGYEPYCPYTVDPGPGGEWTAPDLAKARELIRRAGAEGTRVEVRGFPLNIGGIGLKVSLYFKDLLNDLGFRATHKAFPFPPDRYFDRLYSEKPQIGIAGWAQDYPAPSSFIDLLLSCGAPHNSTGLCDRQVEGMIHRALRLQAVDPPRAFELWAETEHRIVDLAPWVPLVNPVGLDVISERVGDYQRNPQWGLLVDQLWVT